MSSAQPIEVPFGQAGIAAQVTWDLLAIDPATLAQTVSIPQGAPGAGVVDEGNGKYLVFVAAPPVGFVGGLYRFYDGVSGDAAFTQVAGPGQALVPAAVGQTGAPQSGGGAFSELRARARLAGLVQPDAIPKLDALEIGEVLALHRRASLWTAGASFGIGERVQVVQAPPYLLFWPASVPAYGVYYRCLQAGATGDAEPNWFTGGSFVYAPYRIVDGGVLWGYDGLAMPDLWDINAAARECWMRKAAKVAGKYDIGSAQQRMSRSQMYEQCIRQANRFAPVYVI